MKKIVISKLELKKNEFVRQEIYVNCECFSLDHLIRIVVEKYKDDDTTIYFESNATTYFARGLFNDRIKYHLQVLKSRIKNAFNIFMGKNSFLTFDFLFYADTGLELSKELKKVIETVEKTKL